MDNFGSELYDQLKQLQKDERKYNPDGLLGTLDAAGIEMPKIYVKRDYPHNGPWEKSCSGVDTRFKQMFVAEYDTRHKDHTEGAMELFKSSGHCALSGESMHRPHSLLQKVTKTWRSRQWIAGIASATCILQRFSLLE